MLEKSAFSHYESCGPINVKQLLFSALESVLTSDDCLDKSL